MDFSTVDLSPEDKAFTEEVREFCDRHITEEVLDEERRTGNGFNLGLHLALGERGWILPTWPVEDGGAGLSYLQARILDRELRDREAPMISFGTTTMILPAVLQWGADELKADVVPKVASGHARFCLGYSEPDSGSDIAAAKTRAVRDGDEWVIDGQKMWTTGAQNCQYTFLITRTNPDASKHKGLTMFLCPLDDVEIQAVSTLGGERTNMVFYDGIRLADRYRLGPVDQGWMVLLGPLNQEHAMGEVQAGVPLEVAGGHSYGHAAALAVEAAAEWAATPDADGRRPIDDPVVRQRLARAALQLEIATCSEGPIGRIVTSETSIAVSEDMLGLVGPAGLLAHGEPGAVADGILEYLHRFAQGTATYGGTTDIHRNIIAERFLGLPRGGVAPKSPVG
ncbi:MAG TPA: acyl-CoA dehydrogenase family protein [Acidimicrobiales bacterium]|nr:acyl-CoA dehydrogenase family protein [Acidimicrobiales bacterium]